MNAQTLTQILAALGALVALGNAYLQGGLAGVLASLPTVIGAAVAGWLGAKRPHDISPAMMRVVEADRSVES